MNGFLSILKPPGLTSSAVVLHIKRCLPRGTKIGHAGTLDPEAAGVLPIMIGKATRLFDYTTEKKKIYIAEIIFGIETDTQDSTGAIINRKETKVSVEKLLNIIPLFEGDIEQIPPMYSAIKLGGQRLYDLAREGTVVKREKRPVHVYSIEVINKNDPCLLKITCAKGTYIRTLCHDIGRAMGEYACMGMLIRTSSGVFTIENAHTLEEINGVSDIEEHILPMDYPLQDMQAVYLSSALKKAVWNGTPISKKLIDTVSPENMPVRIYCDHTFCGIGQFDKEYLRFNSMLLEK